ncbi:DUF4259 domain-containing protein [Janthinobacterium agaricidamnosum]|uniref:Conserved hypothethical protein n=1 Tax=Janthinobacterium agaricidamnosum NBRC 102515 = DSM 9628 TaxID=1349767 RepID=W0V2I1_9BURK|nr:DUF4259 domain-containing protein [Janthinobacterium agaricidamnosum]CDG81457.1 conserved hypothethical protein [Janthinobacterium agaricidamnosum NBRC 102515 = DSM 9628]
MATWSADAFGNDYAMDWAQDLQEYKNLELIETTLDNVIDSHEEILEAPFAAEALAAVDVLLRLLGKPGSEDIADIDGWVGRRQQNVTPPLIGKARAALARILSEQSELRQLWQESEHYDAWQSAVAALQNGLPG